MSQVSLNSGKFKNHCNKEQSLEYKLCAILFLHFEWYMTKKKYHAMGTTTIDL